MKFLLIIYLGIFITSCAQLNSKSLSSKDNNCLNEMEINAKLQPLLQVYSRAFSDEKNVNAILLEDQCWKKKYKIGEYAAIIYRNENSPDEIIGSILKIRPNKISKVQCLERALADINELKISFSDRLIEQYKTKYPKTWADEDIGPVKWLDCQTGNLADWFSSLGMFLHENSHALQSGNCLFPFKELERTCFSFSATLPKANIAKLVTYPTQEKKSIEGINFFQNLYLHDNESPIALIDEVRAYVITTTTETASLQKHNKKGIIPELNNERSRSYLALPQMLNHLVLYLEVLKNQDREQFDQFLIKENVTSLKYILQHAEQSYAEWLSQIYKAGIKPRDLEIIFWKEYQKRKNILKII